ncbi:uncharacterized protein LOC124266795 [Haliotis rubra]|uniref:uncharacterized protein LOC124266795 n=1 Tax=Haliotis rubra TaxID=36100 RepID=UPI001EE4ED30|nr:uncharacterized protein LOC124266795 [Haliotis rubra]
MNYGSWKLPDLKTELKARGARVSGRKIDLIERLESYDRNCNFGREPELEPEFEMTLPLVDTYKDVNSDSKLPFLAYESIHSYLQPFKKKLGMSAKNLYTSRFLKYVRFSNHIDSNMYFLKSECHAEMKKHVTYKVDVAIDEDGSVVEGQCECAAGQGPSGHCKHICAVLFAMHTFSTTGDLLTEETCTQRLQTFHKSKPYTGSPIKAADLDLCNSELGVIFDPRPVKYRKVTNYPDYFRNVWLNHPCVNTLPVSQMFPPADPFAVNHDHDYLELSSADQYLKSQNISEISDVDKSNIEILTRKQSKSEDWRTEHTKRISSSNFGKICLASDKTDFHKLARTMTEPFEDIQSPPLRHGRKYEKVAIKAFQKSSGCKTSPCGMFVSDVHPFLAASPDAILGDDTTVEVKCPFASKDRVISEITVPYLKVSDGKLTLDTSRPYFFQVQGQLYCTGNSDDMHKDPNLQVQK